MVCDRHDFLLSGIKLNAFGCCDFVGEIGAQNGECQFDHLKSSPVGSLSVRAHLIMFVELGDVEDFLAWRGI
jgi:hypothetical protein